MRTTKKRKISRQTMRRAEVETVDYYIDAHLIQLSNAIKARDTKAVAFQKKQLETLTVRRHYLDPQRWIENKY